MATLKEDLKGQSIQAFSQLYYTSEMPTDKVGGWIYSDKKSEEIKKTADAETRNAVIAQKAAAYKGANPLGSSIEYLGIHEDLFGDDYYYRATNKHGSFIITSKGHTLNKPTGIRGEGPSISSYDLDRSSEEIKEHIMALCPPVTQDENGKWKSVAYPQYALPFRESAERLTQEYVGVNVCTYYTVKAIQLYVEQNKDELSQETLKLYEGILAQQEKSAVENLESCGIKVNQQTGSMKRAVVNTVNRSTQKSGASR